MSSLLRDVDRYERWLRDQCDIVKADLALKHLRMREDAFVFLRATYFRWARRIEGLCPELTSAPRVLCVGDVHVENFGTWRDAEARHVWGVNDFDEAAVMPYPYDLVRLLVSARLSPHFKIPAASAAEAILDGYTEGLMAPGPMLLDSGAPWMQILDRHLREAEADFWEEIAKYPDAEPPAKVRKALRSSLPTDATITRYATRRKGGGGLGRPRYVAIADWRGGKVLREAKAMVPSAWNWALGKTNRSRFLDVAYGAFRSPDPSVRVANRYLLRRVAPDSRKLDLKDVAKRGLGLAALTAMAKELGSIHSAHRLAASIPADLATRGRSWLPVAAIRVQEAVEVDYAQWMAETDGEGNIVARRKRGARRD